MESFLKDLGYSLRILRQTPSFTITAVGALALGIGANTAIFTVVHAVILNPLPYPGSDRIVSISHPGSGQLNEPTFNYLNKHNPGLLDLTAYHAGASMNLNSGDRSTLVNAITASRNYFRLFGAHPILGRTFSDLEDQPGSPRVLVLSYGLWQSQFGGQPSVVGTTITLGGAPYSVIGVISPNFRPYPLADVWAPLQADPDSQNLAGILTVSGRLPGNRTLAQANSQVAVIGSRSARTSSRFKGDPKLQVTFLRQQITGDIRPALLILLGAVGLVLLTACANVANLLLARATARRQEIAIRAALGAGRGRIVRQLLAESLLLSLTGGAVGLVLGSLAVRALLAFTPGDLPRLQEIAAVPALDPRITGFTFLMAIFTSVPFGLIPAFHLARTELTAALNDSGSRAGGSRRQNHARGALVAAEVATAVVLLCGALLLIRGFAAMHNVDLGFNPAGLLTMEVSLAGPGYAKSSAVDRVARQFVERAERIPGVQSAALASALPLWGKMDMIFDILGRAPAAGRQFTGDVQWRFVSSNYFDVLQIPLISGRLLRDREPGRTVVISQAMARKFWPGESPVGRSIFIGPALGPAYQEGVTVIVGVVGDVRERLNIDPQPVMYQAPSQIPDADMALLNGYEPGAILIRAKPGIALMSLSQAVQQALFSGEQLAAAKVRTMDRVGLDSTARQNFSLLLLGLFAAIALLLAAVGIYGVMSYIVEQRTHEIGIRAALGASRRDTLSLVLFQSLRMTLAGVTAGIAASLGLTRLLTAQLFGVKPSDPITFAAAPLILLTVALAAACIPALRATRIDPLTALRHE
jgi:putative ABC transport system permease protein